MRVRLTMIGWMLLGALSLFGQGYRKRLTLGQGLISNIWLCPAPGDGLYVASFQNNVTSKYSLFLSKITASGNLEWTRKSNADRLGIGVTSDPTGNIYLVYEPLSNNSIEGVVVEKISATGQTIWQKKDNSNAFSLSYHAVLFQNGQLLVSNKSKGLSRITSFQSNSGGVSWTRLYDCTVTGVNDNMYQLVGLNDGTFLATTQAAHYINTSYLRSVLHLDASGDIIAVKNHNGFAMLDMAQLTDGDIAFTAKSDGTGQPDQYYIGVMTPNLDFKWVKKVRSVPGHQILGMERVDNSGFIVCLQNPGDDCLGESVVFRSDNMGNIQWSKALKDGAFFSIQHLAMPDNGLAWVSYNPVIDTAVIINRVNNNGLIGACPTTDSQPFTLVDTTIVAVSANWEVSPGEPWVSTQPLTFVPINAAIEDYCPNLALDASFILSEDTVCQQTIIQAVPDNILGNSNWFFGVNGVLGTRVTPGSVRAVMSQPGLIPITHVRSLGLCSDTLVQQVWVKPGPLANLGPDQSICPGDSTTIAPPTASNVSIEWSTGATDSELLVTVPGTYAITVEGPECSSVDTIKITQAPVPVVDLGADQVFCLDETFTITPTVTPQGGSFLWSDGSTGATLEVRDSNQYKLTVQIGECTATDSVVIGFQWCPGVFLYVPNVFAPDGTAENNTFKTSSFSVELKKMAVYDRWGSLVFQTTGAPFEWNGQVKGETAAPGVYAYWIEYLDTLSGDLLTQTGSVTVIR